MDDFIRRIEAIKADIENAKGDFIEYSDYQIGVRQGFRFALDIIENHTKDMTPRTGKWISEFSTAKGSYVYICSECGNFCNQEPGNYCPNCGARMKGEDE